MRIYIIGSDGITLCREPPAAVNEGEIAVASSEELHAARLSGKRLLALWNALAGVEKLRKVAGRDALIEQLGSAIESLPDPQSARPAVVGQASVLNQKFVSTLGLDDDRAVTKPFDGGQDVVGGFGPAKGLGVGIAGVDVGGDSGLQRGGRAVGAALDLLVGEQREEALDLVDP